MGGGDKFLVDLCGRPLIEHVIERLRPQVDALAISANGDPSRIPSEFPIVPDTAPSRGPLSGLRAGLLWARDVRGTTHLVTSAADTPFLPKDLVARLHAAGADRVALACSGGRRHPTFGLWRVDVIDELEAFLVAQSQDRVSDFAARCGAVDVDFDDDDAFFNINTPQDLAAARARLLGKS